MSANHQKWFIEASYSAQSATCLRRRCGAVVVADRKIIGRGFNSPPAELESQRRCKSNIDKCAKYPTDKTCCAHAEVRAICDALTHNPAKVVGSTLYFVSIDDYGELEYAGVPYCTICSKLALDVGIAYFGLWHEPGYHMYNTVDYNNLSFRQV